MKQRLLITISFIVLLFVYSYYKPEVKEEVNEYPNEGNRDLNTWKNNNEGKLWE